MAKRGRKNAYYTKIQPKLMEIKDWVEKEGLLNQEICKRLGISHNTFYKYVEEYEEFSNIIYNADKRPLIQELEKTAFQVAKGYFIEEEKTVIALDENGQPSKRTKEIYKKYQAPNARMLEFLLVNWAQDKYKRDPIQADFKEAELAFKKELAKNGWGLSEEEFNEKN